MIVLGQWSLCVMEICTLFLTITGQGTLSSCICLLEYYSDHGKSCILYYGIDLTWYLLLSNLSILFCYQPHWIQFIQNQCTSFPHTLCFTCNILSLLSEIYVSRLLQLCNNVLGFDYNGPCLLNSNLYHLVLILISDNCISYLISFEDKILWFK